MTDKDLYEQWRKLDSAELTESRLGDAFSSVKSRIRAAEESALSGILSSELHERRQRRKIRILSAVAAVACLMLPLTAVQVARHSYGKGLSAQASESMVEMCEYAADAGEIRHVLLPDSTTVVLNSGSVLICPSEFRGDRRSVYLNGEASFDVTKDAVHEFVVGTSDMEITVHGTKFNVSSYSGDRTASTTLSRGSISVVSKKDGCSMFLHPGQKFIIDRTCGTASVENVNADEDLAWETGKLCFRSKSIHEIVQILERRYAVRIYVTTGKYDNDLITAKFIQGETLDELMSALCKLIPGMSYRKDNSNIYIR